MTSLTVRNANARLAGEKKLGFVHHAVKCECDTCRYCYICQDDEVKWSYDNLRVFMDGDCGIKLGEGRLPIY
jgi:hypothetical protein